ncbi:MAG: hypothetical protein COA42_22110 [Alteromonadaceae bacterium]|nr:polysaccharide pyruvyl transferase family protein [Colwellia sp.]PCK02560.1 MAG: hypothetical protein COA42_22110 [Alteromonadaceae bacterium]
MIHAALRKADYISYRDCASKELIESDQPGFEGEVFPDLAFGLNFTPISKTTRRNKPLIGINPMPVYDYRYWNVRDDGQYHAYVAKLARLAERLISENYPVVFFPTMWRDDYVIIDILKEMDPKIRSKVEDSKLVNHCDEVSELTNLLQDIDIVVATRFHGTLLPLLVNTPVLGISYYRKNADLMNEFGQDDYHETLEECDVDRLYSKLMTLASNLQQTKADIFQKTKEYQDLTAKQWDRIIQLIT